MNQSNNFENGTKTELIIMKEFSTITREHILQAIQ